MYIISKTYIKVADIILNTMANFTDLNATVSGLFDVLGTLISEVVDLFVNNLIELVFVGAIISLIVWFVRWIADYIKRTSNSNMKMK